ncbi:MAG: N-methyl-L-tryptophan oxidase [Egibacteraceae bacterium]
MTAVEDVDTIVVGLGVMGGAALAHLAADGVDCLGVEQHKVGHAFGSSHGPSRVFRLAYPDALYVDMARAARALWEDLEERTGLELLTMCGMVAFARSGNDAFKQVLSTMDVSGVANERLDAEAVAERFPALRVPADAEAVFTPEAGLIHADRSVAAQVAEARRAGARVHEGTPVTTIDARAKRPQIQTTAGRFRCRRLVLSPGPWAPGVLVDLRLPLWVTRQEKLHFDSARPDMSGPDRLPIYADYDAVIYGLPDHGAGLAAADDRLGATTSPEDIDRELDPAARERMLAWMRERFPALAPTYAHGVTCMYTMTPDRDFLIGPHPANPAVLVAAGFSGHGFKFGPLVGRIIADLATTGRTDGDLSRFRLDRFAP